MEADSVTIRGPIFAMVIGAIVLIYGMAQGGLNPVSTAGGLLMVLGVAWLAVKIDSIT